MSDIKEYVSADHEQLLKCYKSLKKIIAEKAPSFVPKVAAVLDLGLSSFANRSEIIASISFSEIDAFPEAKNSKPVGSFVLAKISGIPVVLMTSRLQYHDGYTMQETVLPIRLMYLIGASDIILTNAVGAVDFELSTGNFVLIKDHISFFVPSPLHGANIPIGNRSPLMNKVYDSDLFASVHAAALDEGIVLKEENYLQVAGPQFETPAEIRMARHLGAGVVGMGIASEAIAASHCGMKVCAIACVTNLASGMSDTPSSHEDIERVAAENEPSFGRLLSSAIFAVANVRKYIFTEEEMMMPHIIS